MKTSIFVLSVRRLVVLLCLGGLMLFYLGARAAIAKDHLIPTAGEIDASYRDLLRRKLSTTPKDYGQIIVVTGGTTGEHAIAIYSSAQSPTGVLATYTKADKNLGNETWKENPKRINEASIKIDRVEAPLARAVALTVSEALTDLLSRVARRDITGRAEDVVFDGTPILVLLQKKNSAAREGILPPESHGAIAMAVRRIDHYLVSYCLADPGRREHIAARLTSEAKTLSLQAKARSLGKVPR
jgi:hypothetical protein